MSADTDKLIAELRDRANRATASRAIVYRKAADRIASLEAALAPFAAAKDYFDGYVRDDDIVDCALRHIRAHHVRAAASALSERKEGQDG